MFNDYLGKEQRAWSKEVRREKPVIVHQQKKLTVFEEREKSWLITKSNK